MAEIAPDQEVHQVFMRLDGGPGPKIGAPGHPASVGSHLRARKKTRRWGTGGLFLIPKSGTWGTRNYIPPCIKSGGSSALGPQLAGTGVFSRRRYTLNWPRCWYQ